MLIFFHSLNGQITNSFTSANSDLPGDVVKAVYVDEYGNKWFGTDEGLAMFNGATWVVYTDSTGHAMADKIINDVDLQCTELHGNELWLGTINGVTVAGYGIDGITAATSYRSGDADVTLVSNMINAVAVDSAGVRYFGTDDGLAVFAGASWLYFDENSNPDIPDVEILSIDAEEDSIYIGLAGGIDFNSEGVSRIQNKPDGFTGASTYVYPYNIPSASVFKVFVDSKGYRWFGTGYGTVRHTHTKGKDEGKDMLISTANGLAGNNVYAINEDPDNNFWFGTDQGVSKMNVSGEITNYTTSDGLINNMVYDIDYNATNGNVWFATAGGVSYMENGFVPNTVEQHRRDEPILSVTPSVITETAEIKFMIPDKGYIELAVYNMAGQKVKTLFKGHINNSEQVIMLNVNSDKFTGGIYIMRLEMEMNIVTRKFIVL